MHYIHTYGGEHTEYAHSPSEFQLGMYQLVDELVYGLRDEMRLWI